MTEPAITTPEPTQDAPSATGSDTPVTEGTAQEAVPAQPSDKGDDKTETKGPIPYERFDEVNQRAKKAEDELRQIKADQEAVRTAASAKRGEYKQLFEAADAELKELRPLKEDLAKERASQRQGLLESFSEEERTLYEDMDIVKLRQVVKLRSDKQPEPVDTSSPGGGAGERPNWADPKVTPAQKQARLNELIASHNSR